MLLSKQKYSALSVSWSRKQKIAVSPLLSIPDWISARKNPVPSRYKQNSVFFYFFQIKDILGEQGPT